jgi:mediator of RNA polymerase II transcription subunit 12
MVWEKQRVSPWEIIEGQKNPAQLSWGWFGAVKMERKPLRYEEAHRFLRFHNHNTIKPNSHFLDPVPLPPEDVDVVKPEIHIKEEGLLMGNSHHNNPHHLQPHPHHLHAHHHLIKTEQHSPMMTDHSQIILPTIASRTAKQKTPRRKRLTKAQAAAAAASQQQAPPPSLPPPPQQQQQPHPPNISSPVIPPPQMPPVPSINSFNPPPVAVQNQMPPVPLPNNNNPVQGPPPNYPQSIAQGNSQAWYNGNPNQQQQQQQQQQNQPMIPPPQQQQQQFFGQGPPQQGPGPGNKIFLQHNNNPICFIY